MVLPKVGDRVRLIKGWPGPRNGQFGVVTVIYGPFWQGVTDNGFVFNAAETDFKYGTIVIAKDYYLKRYKDAIQKG